MFPNRWIAVQPRVTTAVDVLDLRRWEAAQVIADWPEDTATLLAVLDGASLPVGMWRFANDPHRWPGFPTQYVGRARLAQFWNEPDVEGAYPDWYHDACSRWRGAGGLLVRPANSDETKRGNQDDLAYDVLGTHCYGDRFDNLELVRAGSGGRRVIVTEYGAPHRQSTCLVACQAIPETVVIFCHRWEGNSAAGYDTAGVALTQPLPTLGEAHGVSAQSVPIVGEANGVSTSSLPTNGTAGGSHTRSLPTDEAANGTLTLSLPTVGAAKAPVVSVPGGRTVAASAPWAFPQLDQGWTKLCGPYCIEAAQDAVGRHVGALEIYRQVKDKDYTAPGEAMTFDELIQGVHIAAEMGRCEVAPWRGVGGISRVDDVEDAVAQGHVVIAGVWMADLVPDQLYYHYLLVQTLGAPTDGSPRAVVVDSYEREDGGPSSYPWWLLRKAMLDNWTDPVHGLDAYAYTLSAR